MRNSAAKEMNMEKAERAFRLSDDLWGAVDGDLVRQIHAKEIRALSGTRV